MTLIFSKYGPFLSCTVVVESTGETPFGKGIEMDGVATCKEVSGFPLLDVLSTGFMCVVDFCF